MKYFLLSISLLIVNCFKAQNFQWAKAVKGKYTEIIMSSCVDASGNYYATGSFQDTVDFDPGAGIYNLITDENPDIFISKLDAAGNFVWAKSIQSNGWDRGNSIAVDANGEIVIIGFYNGSADFDPGVASFSLTPSGGSGQDGFILKLNTQGNFIWAKSIGGNTNENIDHLVTDNLGNIYFTGIFNGTTDLDPGPANVFINSNTGSIDFFIEKLDAFGNYVWAKTIGGPKAENCTSLAIDGNGNLCALGTFSGTVDFDPNAGITNMTSNGGDDLFIVKLNNVGNLVWVNTFGGPQSELSGALKTDALGNCYTASSFFGIMDADPSIANSFTLNAIGGCDICLQKFDSNGNFVWAKQIAGNNNELVFNLVLNNSAGIFLTGYFEGTVDFDPSLSINNLSSNGGADIFVQSLDKDGNFVWVYSAGGTGNDYGFALCADNSNVFIGGTFYYTVDFDPGPATYNFTSATSDVFILKLNQGLTGLKEFTTKLNTVVFPNPTVGDITIQLDKEYSIIEIELVNVTGQLIMKKQELLTGKSIGLNFDATSGIYFLSVKVDNEISSTFKIIKS
jgi:hypothetical protein